jgi:hypothetical protein
MENKTACGCPSKFLNRNEIMSLEAMRVYVLWAPSVEGAQHDPGYRLARDLHDRLDALGMIRDGMGFRIPVRQRSHAWQAASTPRPIDLAAARSNVVIVVEDHLMRGREGWAQYVAKIAADMDKDTRRGVDLLLPVTTSQGRNLPAFEQRTLQGIVEFTPEDKKDEAAWSRWIRRVVMYVMGVIWVHQRTGVRRRNDATGQSRSKSSMAQQDVRKIGVFLSHAKKDGKGAALLFDRFRRLAPRRNGGGVNSVDMYFDAYDTVAGKSYEDQFEKAIQDGALLSIVTDAYHGRPWCMWELLTAKKHQSPIVIWDLSHRGALRTFPYLGNVPVVHTSDVRFANADEDELADDSISDVEIERVLLALLAEALRMEVWTAHAEAVVRDSPQITRPAAVCARPPELVDLARYSAKKTKKVKVIVYPDPPIGRHERSLLEAAFPKFALTPLSEVR